MSKKAALVFLDRPIFRGDVAETNLVGQRSENGRRLFLAAALLAAAGGRPLLRTRPRLFAYQSVASFLPEELIKIWVRSAKRSLTRGGRAPRAT